MILCVWLEYVLLYIGLHVYKIIGAIHMCYKIDFMGLKKIYFVNLHRFIMFLNEKVFD